MAANSGGQQQQQQQQSPPNNDDENTKKIKTIVKEAIGEWASEQTEKSRTTGQEKGNKFLGLFEL